MRDNKAFLVIIGGLLLFLVVGGMFVLASKGKSLSKEEQMAILGARTGYSMGTQDAPVKIIEYSDFECPACAQVYPFSDKVLADYDGKVLFEFRHFPLNNIHKNAQVAAEASEAAGAQGKFWEMHDKLFETQDKWVNLDNDSLITLLVEYAGEMGVTDLGRFQNEIERQIYADVIAQDAQAAKDLKLSGTPSIFVNGQKLEKLSYDELKKSIESQL